MNSVSALAFDVYGTLIDTNGVLQKLQQHVGTQAQSVSATWRAKQLEYSFRRGLMQRYVPFPIVTRQALDYALSVHNLVLDESAKQDIQGSYSTLPAFPDAIAALQRLQSRDVQLFAFSNGPQQVVSDLLEQANLLPYFKQVVSVESTKVFKPSPVVYQHFASTAGVPITDCALVSGNPFDVIGAISAGMQGIWVQRSSNSQFDTWEIEPNQIITDLTELAV